MNWVDLLLESMGLGTGGGGGGGGGGWGGSGLKKKKKGTLETQTNNEKTEVKAFFFYCNLIPCYSVDFTRDLVNREPLEQTN